MANLHDPDVLELLEKPNYAIVSTHNPDQSIHSTVVWIDMERGNLALNSAVGRKWPTNLQRDPRVNVLVQETANPYYFVEVRGTAEATTDGADEHIDRLAKKYTGQCEYPNRRPGEERITFLITADRVRLVKQ